MVDMGNFYEDDEDLDGLLAEFDSGDQGFTSPPALPGGAIVMGAPLTFASASTSIEAATMIVLRSVAA